MKTTDPQGELLDIVDVSDQVVGQATRGEIHRLQLRHRACHMIVFDSSGKVFVQKRSLSKDNSPGLWDSSAAGHVDAGESYIDCAVRELGEELGLTISASDLEQRIALDASPATGMEFTRVYTLVSDEAMTYDPIEVADGQWCTEMELDRWIQTRPQEITEAFRLIWRKLRELDL